MLSDAVICTRLRQHSSDCILLQVLCRLEALQRLQITVADSLAPAWDWASYDADDGLPETAGLTAFPRQLRQLASLEVLSLSSCFRLARLPPAAVACLIRRAALVDVWLLDRIKVLLALHMCTKPRPGPAVVKV